MNAEVFLPLSQGKVAVIDFDDFEKVRGMKWTAFRGRGATWYAFRKEQDPRTGVKKNVFLHRFLMSATPGELVDHRDRDGLNNRCYNLRSATRSQNGQNQIKPKGGSSRFKGVHWYGPTNKWAANICVNKSRIFLGYFFAEGAAARAYDTAAKKYFGEYAVPNFE